MLRSVVATRYVTPLREGGSLPGLMEADDLGTYVVKYTGAGQGVKALVAEVISGELARQLGLAVPALVTVEVDPVLATNEPDEEIQELLRRSPGRNLGVDFLPGALDLDPTAFPLDPVLAGRVLWFDAFVGNVDRSWRNPNLLLWHGEPFLIDHGATLVFHHSWRGAGADVEAAAAKPYDAGEHVLLGSAPDLDVPDPLPSTTMIAAALAEVPDEWLGDDPAAERHDYARWFATRLATRDEWGAALRDAVRAGPTRATRGQRPRWLS